MQTTPIEIHAIFSSPAHNYFTREKFQPYNAKNISHKRIKLRSGRGIEDDRFEFSTYPITLFSLEVAQEVCSRLNLTCNLALFRRNIIVSGLHLNSLIGQQFSIGDVTFEGMAHCAPCPWMNAVFAKGAYALMRGRGGLRVKVIKGGLLTLGQQSLNTQAILGNDPLEPLKRAFTDPVLSLKRS